MIGKLKKSSLILLVAITFLLATTPVHAQATKIYIDPTPIYAHPCEEFTVDLNVADVVDLRGWEIKMLFDPTTVKCISIEQGPFLNTGHATTWDYSIDNAAGTVEGRCYFLPAVSVTGSGTLAKVTFHCLGPGDTVLRMNMSWLEDPTMRAIPHDAVDGYVQQLRPPTKAGRAHIAKSGIVKLKYIPVMHSVSSYVKGSLIVKLDKAISKIDMALVYMEMGITLCDLYLRMAKGAMYEFITIVRSSMFFTAIPGPVGEMLISIALACTDRIQLAIETPL